MHRNKKRTSYPSRVRLGHWAMLAECPVFPRADIGRRFYEYTPYSLPNTPLQQYCSLTAKLKKMKKDGDGYTKYAKQIRRDLKKLRQQHGVSLSFYWYALMREHARFIKAVNDRTSPLSQWRTARRRYIRLSRIVAARPHLRDKNERELLSYFITNRALPFLEFWADVIENGKLEEVSGAPPWADEDLTGPRTIKEPEEFYKQNNTIFSLYNDQKML